MTDWKIDERFLDYIAKKFESDGGLKDLVGVTKPLVGVGQKEYSMNDLVHEMRQGTRIGKRLYSTLYGIHEKEFRENLVDGNPLLEWTNQEEGFFRNTVLERMGHRQYVVEYDCGEMGSTNWHRQIYVFRATDDTMAKTLAEGFVKQMEELRGDQLRISDLHELRTEWRAVNVGSLETKIKDVEEVTKNAINFQEISDLH